MNKRQIIGHWITIGAALGISVLFVLLMVVASYGYYQRNQDIQNTRESSCHLFQTLLDGQHRDAAQNLLLTQSGQLDQLLAEVGVTRKEAVFNAKRRWRESAQIDCVAFVKDGTIKRQPLKPIGKKQTNR